MDDDLHKIIDILMADQLVARAFHTRLLLHLALHESDPDAFVTRFVTGLHRGIDLNDSQMGGASKIPQVHELACRSVDRLGIEVLAALKAVRQG